MTTEGNPFTHIDRFIKIPREWLDLGVDESTIIENFWIVDPQTGEKRPLDLLEFAYMATPYSDIDSNDNGIHDPLFGEQFDRLYTDMRAISIPCLIVYEDTESGEEKIFNYILIKGVGGRDIQLSITVDGKINHLKNPLLNDPNGSDKKYRGILRYVQGNVDQITGMNWGFAYIGESTKDHYINENVRNEGVKTRKRIGFLKFNKDMELATEKGILRMEEIIPDYESINARFGLDIWGVISNIRVRDLFTTVNRLKKELSSTKKAKDDVFKSLEKHIKSLIFHNADPFSQLQELEGEEFKSNYLSLMSKQFGMHLGLFLKNNRYTIDGLLNEQNFSVVGEFVDHNVTGQFLEFDGRRHDLRTNQIDGMYRMVDIFLRTLIDFDTEGSKEKYDDLRKQFTLTAIECLSNDQKNEVYKSIIDTHYNQDEFKKYREIFEEVYPNTPDGREKISKMTQEEIAKKEAQVYMYENIFTFGSILSTSIHNE